MDVARRIEKLSIRGWRGLAGGATGYMPRVPFRNRNDYASLKYLLSMNKILIGEK